MLNIETKIKYFQEYLLDTDASYHAQMKEEIYLYFFELENGNFSFLDSLKTKSDIEHKVDFLVSKMIMHEHEDGLYTIIENYI